MMSSATGYEPCSPAGSSRGPGTPLGTNKSIKLGLNGRTPGRGKSKDKLDRFIPNRSAIDMDAAYFNLTKENISDNASGSGNSPEKSDFKRMLSASMNVDEAGRILAFKHKAPAPPEGFENGLKAMYNSNLGPAPSKKQSRYIPQTQERILDAPDIVDDYYLNLLDWNANNVIAVALGPTVYLWNSTSGSVESLCDCPTEGDYVTSVAWASDGVHLAVGTSDAKVQIWDAGRAKQVRELTGHTARVSCVAWNATMLTSGGKDSTINNWDVRKRKDQACVAHMVGHEQEVCGLKWSHCGSQLASGGNDNLLCIWDAAGRLQHKINAHQAAVKAVAWCPFQSNLVATGGGTADRCIKFWNTHTGAMLNSIDTGSQVCALQWNPHEREILSSHGFSKYQLSLWRYPSLTKVSELTGHTGRVLHMATSPDGSTVVSAAADETLRFWKVFGDPVVAKDEKAAPGGGQAANQSFPASSTRLR